VALAIARQRLLTTTFDYYQLAHPLEGVGSGFVCETVPHITLKSIANSEPPATETLYDRPLVDHKRTRVSGPFTVEAVPAPAVRPLSDVREDLPADDSVARKGETLRQSEWKDELFKTGIRGKKGQRIEFVRLETMPGTRWLHADGETKEDKPQRVVVSFGPEYAPLEQRQVSLALEEAQRLVPKPKMVVFAYFQADPEAAKDIDETDWPGVVLLRAQMNADLLTEDLKKQRSSNESFWLVGQPEVKVLVLKGTDKGKLQVEVCGFDYYNTKTGNIESGGKANIAMWMLDTDYDGRSIFPTQVFFPMAGPKDGWSRLAKTLMAEIDQALIETYRGTISLPFEPGKNKRVAVKIVDDRGIESLKLIEV
jgi:adenine-specific DNA-methyltransferase